MYCNVEIQIQIYAKLISFWHKCILQILKLMHNNLYPLSDDERAQFRNISRFTANSIRSLQCLQKNVKVPSAPPSSIKASFWSTSLSASLSSLNNQRFHYGDHHIINIRLILHDITKVMYDLRQQQRKTAKIWRTLSTIISSSPTRGSLSSTLGLLGWSSCWHVDSKSIEPSHMPYLPGKRKFW